MRVSPFSLETLGQSTSESIEIASTGDRWPDIHIYIRRGWSDAAAWTIHVNHSSSSSSETLDRTEQRLQALAKALEIARSLDTPEAKARMEANYQAVRAVAKAEAAKAEAERQAKIDADPAMGEMNAADRVLDMIDAARANQGQVQVFFAQTRGERRRVKFTALRNWGTNMVFIKMAGDLISKEKAIKALGAMSHEIPEQSPIIRR